MKLDAEVDVAEASRGQKSDDDDPPRERRRIDRIEILTPVPVHPILSATRSLALRERGLARCSTAFGSTGFGVMRRNEKSGLGRGSGHSGRSSHSRLRTLMSLPTLEEIFSQLAIEQDTAAISREIVDLIQA